MKILILVVILLSGVFAGEKIGVPFIPLGEGNVDSMVISKNGDIYTLKDDLVSKYSLSPVNKIDSFKVVLNHPEIHNKYKGYQITISNDSKRIILYSVYEIQLWDIERKKLLKKIKTSLDLGTMSKYGLLVLSQGSKNILNYITIVIFL